MARRTVRTLNAFVAIGGLVGLAWLPQEHLHRTHAQDGHHASVAHRHVEAHQARENHAAFDEQDTEIEWFDASFTTTQHSAPAQPALALLPDPVVCLDTFSAARCWAFQSVPASVHDPPWMPASGPRAPPLLSA